MLVFWRSPAIIETTFLAVGPLPIWSVMLTSILIFSGNACSAGAAFAGAGVCFSSAAAGFGLAVVAAGFAWAPSVTADKATAHINITTRFNIGFLNFAARAGTTGQSAVQPSPP